MCGRMVCLAWSTSALGACQCTTSPAICKRPYRSSPLLQALQCSHVMHIAPLQRFFWKAVTVSLQRLCLSKALMDMPKGRQFVRRLTKALFAGLAWDSVALFGFCAGLTHLFSAITHVWPDDVYLEKLDHLGIVLLVIGTPISTLLVCKHHLNSVFSVNCRLVLFVAYLQCRTNSDACALPISVVA